MTNSWNGLSVYMYVQRNSYLCPIIESLLRKMFWMNSQRFTPKCIYLKWWREFDEKMCTLLAKQVPWNSCEKSYHRNSSIYQVSSFIWFDFWIGLNILGDDQFKIFSLSTEQVTTNKLSITCTSVRRALSLVLLFRTRLVVSV